MEYYGKISFRSGFKPITALLIFVLFSVPFMGYGQEASWINQLEKAYSQGDIYTVELILAKQQPSSTQEKAAILYYRAKLAKEKNDIVGKLAELVKKYPKELYGQKGLIELANVTLLEREYPASLNYLKNVNARMIPEKDYLLSMIYVKLEKYDDAIASAQRYINTANDELKKELAYLQIVEAYILSDQYQQARLTLETLKSTHSMTPHQAIIDYKIAYCHEHLSDTTMAISKYRNVISQYPFTEHCFNAERRLYELLLGGSENVKYSDLSFMERMEDEPFVVNDATEQRKNDAQIEQYYLQVNAFSARRNAVEHSDYLNDLGFHNIVFSKLVNNTEYFVVAVGPFNDTDELQKKKTELKNKLNIDSFQIIR
jgi:predicted negative regulator of RcsB-dependent stress response